MPTCQSAHELLATIDYEGGVFQVDSSIPADCSMEPAKCRVWAKVYYPNVSADEKACLDILYPQKHAIQQSSRRFCLFLW